MFWLVGAARCMTSVTLMLCSTLNAGPSWTILTLSSMTIIVMTKIKRSPVAVSTQKSWLAFNFIVALVGLLVIVKWILSSLFSLLQTITMNVRCSSVSVTERLLNVLQGLLGILSMSTFPVTSVNKTSPNNYIEPRIQSFRYVYPFKSDVTLFQCRNIVMVNMGNVILYGEAYNHP